MEIRMLGPLEIWREGVEIEIRGARERALLAGLLVRAGEARSADALIEDLWGAGDLPADPANALQVRVSRLRKALGSDVVATRPGGYALLVEPDAIDAVKFERLVGEARTIDDPHQAVDRLDAALGLWRGPVLSDLVERSEPVDAAAARLAEMRMEAIEARMDVVLALGRHREAVAELDSLVGEHPLRERLRGQLMLALYRSERQADALRVYQQGRAILADELGIEPSPELQRLEDQILLHSDELLPVAPAPSPVTVPSVSAPTPALPQRLTSFVGRGQELEEVSSLLGRERLVTLTGPGGAGKTRLAVEAASHQHLDAVLIELASVAPGASVDEAVAEALGLTTRAGPQPSQLSGTRGIIQDLLSGRDVVLVFDNCEHVLDETASLVTDILTTCPGTRVLAASRERLGVPGERVWPVPALAVGDDGVVGDAERLFADRAEALVPQFALDEVTLPTVRHICRRLDGMPLAIELAAARVSALTVDQIAERLDDRFELLTGGARTALPRHQTLRAAIDWSHSLLGESEALVLRRLGVTRAPWDLATAAALTDDALTETQVVDAVTSLVERSLVERTDVSSGRFRLLETIRAYAADRLDEAGETTPASQRFITHFVGLAAAAEPHLRTARQMPWIGRLRDDRDNLRHAVEMAVGIGDLDGGLRLCGHLGFFWFTEALIDDERRVIEQALAEGGTPVPRARAISALLLMSFLEIGFKQARMLELSDEMLASENVENDPPHLALATFVAGVAHMMSGDDVWGGELLREAAGIAQQAGDPWFVAFADVIGAMATPFIDNTDATAAMLARGVAGLRQVGERWALSFALGVEARSLRARGSYAEALARNDEAMELAVELGSPWAEANLMSEGANILMLEGRYDEAAARHDAVAELARNGSGSLRGFIANARGMLARRLGDPDAAVEFHQAAATLYSGIGARGGESLALDGIGYAHEMRGEWEDAAQHHRQALDLSVSSGDPFAIALAIEGLAGAAAATEPERGALLLGAADAVRRARGLPLTGGERFDVDRAEAALREALGDGAYDEAFARGAMLDMDAAVELAGA